MRTILTFLCFGFFAVFFIAQTTDVRAQSFGINTDVSIVTTPTYPEPNTEVTAKLDAYAIDTTGADITWFIDNIEVSDSKNTREITFSVGDLNKPTKVSAVITSSNGVAFTASHVLTPSRVDIIIEADSLVPLHYKGRALPSSGSTVRVVAVPNSDIDPSHLSYTWILDNKVLFGGPLIGKNVAEFEAPKSPKVFLTLEVSNQQGVTIARKSVLIPIFEPEMYFYEDNPLRGLSRTAIRSPHTLVGDEMTVRAEPYYMSKNIFNTNPHIEWKIDGISVSNPSENPQNITLRSGGGSGTFTVDFHIRNLENLLQGVKDDFIVSF